MDPDQLASKKPADLNLHCFQNGLYSDSAWHGSMSVWFSFKMSFVSLLKMFL